MKHRAQPIKAGGTPHPIDVEIGRKIARRRTQLGMSLAALAAKLRFSARRVHSLEAGQISISASELVAVGSALDVAVFYFFDDRRHDGRISQSQKGSQGRTEEAEELLAAYNNIRDPESRRMLAKVIHKLAAGYGEEEDQRAGTRKRRAATVRPGSGWLN